MIENLIKFPSAIDLIIKIKNFFESNGIKFYSIEEINEGKSKYLKITVSIKIS